MAQTYNCRPSNLLGLSEDPYVSWCLDETVWSWSMFVESKVAEYTNSLTAADQIRLVATRVRAALLGLDVTTVDSSQPPSDEVINAQARGDVEAPHDLRHFRDPAKAAS